MKKAMQYSLRTVYSIVAFALFLSLSGCSWQEYFVVSNTSNEEVIVHFKINENQKGFPIFGDQPMVYKLNKSNEIDWNNKINVTDLDSTLT